MDNLNGWIQKVTGGKSGTPSPEKSSDSLTADTPRKPSRRPHSTRKSSQGSASNNANRNNPNHKDYSPQKKSGDSRTGGRGEINTSRNNTQNKGTAGKRGQRNSSGKNTPRGGRPQNNFRRLPQRDKPTTPSKRVYRGSSSDKPEARRQRPRPMLGVISREVSAQEFPMHEKLPKGDPMRVIPLGGLNEVGKNSMCVEYKDEIVLIDIGLQFPEENMPGIDYVIPDLSYVIENKEKLKAVLITHGHLDHIGAIHLYIEKLGFPTIYATGLTKALIEKRLEEHKLLEKVKIILVEPKKPESRFQLGGFTIEYFAVNHSIPDSTGIYIKTEAGSMVHTGDFKFDLTPVGAHPCDYHKMVKFSQEGVDLIFADSTNALKDGFCPSEKVIENNIGQVIREAAGKRIIVATFASSIGRHQAIIKHAVANGRKIFLAGRSMNDNIRICHELGLINVPNGAIKKLSNAVNDYRPEEVLILTTGSQGEPFAALSRMSRDEHPHIQLTEDDVIAFSSSPIPGNERGLYTVIDAIYRKGTQVITKGDIDIHASGHAFRGDLKLMHSLINPKYIIPIHGEYFMRIAHRQLATEELGYDERHVPMLENGSIVELLGGVARKSMRRVKTELVFVDGKEHADMSEDQLKERLAMAEGGILTVMLELDKKTKKFRTEPRMFSEGFLENPDVHGVILDTVKTTYSKLLNRRGEDLQEKAIVEELTKVLRDEMIMEVDREPVIQILVSFA